MMNRILSNLLIFLICYCPTISCANNQDAALSQLKYDLHKLKEEFDIPAMAIIIVDTDEILFADISGLADRVSGKPANADTIFRIGSITKMFTALAILMLQEDGLLDLDTNVHELTPSIPLRNRWQGTHPIKVSYLLEHTAGLRGLSMAEFEHNTPQTLKQALRWKASERFPRWPPGLHHSYTNVGAGLAEFIIEKVSEQSFSDFVKKRIFTPLGMSSASLDNDEETRLQLATGYDADGHTVIPYWHVFFRAFGAINATPGDMVPFIQMLMNKGLHENQRLLTEASIVRMETPMTSLAAKTGLQFGYGLGNYTSLRNGLLFHGHGGDADGYLSRLGYNRDTELGYFVVINSFKNNALAEIRRKIEDFISDGQRSLAPPLYKLSMEKLRLYSGKYQSVTQRFSENQNDLIVSIKDGKLQLTSGNETLSVLPVNDIHFRYAGESGATSAFIRDTDGKIYLQNDKGNFLKITD